jgi:hypothetical protein
MPDMVKLALSNETYWLHGILKFGAVDVGFPPESGAWLSKVGWFREDLVAFLRHGWVERAEKSECGWTWWVRGSDCDGRGMCVVLEVETNYYRIDLLDILGE